MKKFNNLRVAKKVLLASSVFLILIAGISFENYYNIRKMDSDFKTFYSDRFVAVIELGGMQEAFVRLKANMIMQQVAAEKKDLRGVEKYLNENKPVIEQYVKHYKNYTSVKKSAEEQAIIDTFAAIVKDGVGKRNRFDEAISKGDINESIKHLNGWMTNHVEGSKLINQLIDIQISKSNIMIEDQRKDAFSTKIIILAVLILSILIGVITTYLLSKSVSDPVKKGLAFAELIASGNFLERIDLDQDDELGQLGKALNTAADNLEKLISEVIISSQNLVSAVDEIASGNENLSQRTSEQASSLEEIAATIEETNASTRQNAENAGLANTRAETSSKLALDGGYIVEKAVVSIAEINNSSKKISEIITMINEISFQTNLLALNAAVEAARAGEQGRGFAVVAGEVRNLAQRSAGAAKEIGTLIKDSISKIDEGTDLVNKSGEALKDIILSAKEVKDIISEIAASSDEQSRGIEQINAAITGMDNMTQQNAAMVEETAAASEEMSNQAQELLMMVQKFKISDDLRRKVDDVKSKEVKIKKSHEKLPVKNSLKNESKTDVSFSLVNDGYEKF